MGDKGAFKRLRRYGFSHGYDQSKYTRCVMSICLGKDKAWGDHLTDLLVSSYGVHGTIYYDGRQWLFWTNSSRVFSDLSAYYHPEWNSHFWKVTSPIFEASSTARKAVVRGYFDADGYPNFSKARNQVSLKATSVNRGGIESMKDLLRTIGYGAGIYRRYKSKDVWELCIARHQDVVRFYSHIGFSIVRKQRKLATMLIYKGLLPDWQLNSEGWI